MVVWEKKRQRGGKNVRLASWQEGSIVVRKDGTVHEVAMGV